jgi:hypothetical protein
LNLPASQALPINQDNIGRPECRSGNLAGIHRGHSVGSDGLMRIAPGDHGAHHRGPVVAPGVAIDARRAAEFAL